MMGDRQIAIGAMVGHQMQGAKLGWWAYAWLGGITLLTLGLGLDSATRLTYHEAFVAQGAQEILNSGNWWHPTIGGLPWLEKPPLPFWLAAGLGWGKGTVSPALARLPSAVAAAGMVLGVTLLATRHYGASVGILSGAVQATTAWTVLRGRLAEADILLACLVVWVLLAFDRLRVHQTPASDRAPPRDTLKNWQPWRWLFFGLLGLTALVKGPGFGAVLVLAVIALVLLWDKDVATAKRLAFPAGWAMSAILGLAWPVAMIAMYGNKATTLWVMHITARVGSRPGHGVFAGQEWRAYIFHILGQALPWTPWAAVGAWRSIRRALCGHSDRDSQQGVVNPEIDQVGGHRLLCCWAIAPLALVSLASARNAHYAIYGLIPWSVWTALAVARLGAWQITRGHPQRQLRYLTWSAFMGLAAAYGVGFCLAGPWANRRGTEWAFYEAVGWQLPPTARVILLYDDWDRDAYPTPFGPIPHDLAVRLYYLKRPACWHFDATTLADNQPGACPVDNQHHRSTSLHIVGREHDLPALRRLGEVEVLARSSTARWDRTYLLAKVEPRVATSSPPVAQSAVVLPLHR
jgi:4-amino-4-deoxy-L-arabinose transferase-like glycosyltransferase